MAFMSPNLLLWRIGREIAVHPLVIPGKPGSILMFTVGKNQGDG
jgi:hypothetical protein